MHKRETFDLKRRGKDFGFVRCVRNRREAHLATLTPMELPSPLVKTEGIRMSIRDCKITDLIFLPLAQTRERLLLRQVVAIQRIETENLIRLVESVNDQEHDGKAVANFEYVRNAASH